jgi:hypothetical protein
MERKHETHGFCSKNLSLIKRYATEVATDLLRHVFFSNNSNVNNINIRNLCVLKSLSNLDCPTPICCPSFSKILGA